MPKKLLKNPEARERGEKIIIIIFKRKYNKQSEKKIVQNSKRSSPFIFPPQKQSIP